MANFKNLEVWEKAHALSLFAHQVALGIRGAMYSSIKNQMVRAALSIPTNIVEGREQKTDAEFARYLRYALASTSELEYHAIAGRDIGVIKVDDFISLSAQAKTVRMMLFGLLKRLDK
ncbi:MAG TPA: four helix bundle protein [Gemmatimonadaceae bacterium]|nr:four helix bundle protein [Gemmatimonadaceae bacterium]